MKYTPTQYVNAKDKENFVEHFMKFVEKGFPQKMFNEKFYQRLSMTFGHIAHYNSQGFWETFFTNATNKVRFLTMTLNHPCYGDPSYTFSDAEKEIQRRLVKMNILETWRQTEIQENDNKDYAEYQRLKRKFEVDIH